MSEATSTVVDTQRKLKDNSIDDQDFTIYDARVTEVYDAIRSGTYVGPKVNTLDTQLLITHRTNLQMMVANDFKSKQESEGLLSKGIKWVLKHIVGKLIKGLFKAASFMPKILKYLFKPFTLAGQVLKGVVQYLYKFVVDFFKKPAEMLGRVANWVTKGVKKGAGKGLTWLKNTRVAKGITKAAKAGARAVSKAVNVVGKTASTTGKVVKATGKVVKTTVSTVGKTAKMAGKLAGKGLAFADAIIEGGMDIHAIASRQDSEVAAQELLDQKKAEGLQGLDWISPYRIGQQIAFETGVDKAGGAVGDLIGDFFLAQSKAKRSAENEKKTKYGAWIKEEDVSEPVRKHLESIYGDKWFEVHHLSMWAKYDSEGMKKRDEIFNYIEDIEKNKDKVKDVELKSPDMSNIRSLESVSITKTNATISPIKRGSKEDLTPIKPITSVPTNNMSESHRLLNTGYRL